MPTTNYDNTSNMQTQIASVEQQIQGDSQSRDLDASCGIDFLLGKPANQIDRYVPIIR
ncbi:MAG: hypothetical protein NTW52_04580 [Planctomycetota bacterium]|nr:hypothetical protein [Planctomycetota bacterium]